ncbi:zinc finger protein 271-like [Ischnura elegans]|uniref:zinc finger protein 271-like n=1 Tax=Ischnura elegans TaxID=197161 RepID=UPI001ED89954|nr:zinc finger protein 271-like [Ischnura elegans]
MLETVKDENKDPLSEGNYPEMYTPDSDGISSNALDPLATDDLSGMATCGSPCVKADQISDDGGGYVHNEGTDGATNDLVAQASAQAQASTSSQGEEVDGEGTRAVVIDLDTLLVLAKNELSPKETDATEPTVTENGELIQNRTMAMESMKEAVESRASERASALFVGLEPKIRASHSRKGKKPTLSEDGDPFESSATAHESAFGVPAAEEMPEQTISTSYLLAEGNLRNHSIDECIGPPALVTQIDSKAGTSHEEIEKNLIDEDLGKCGASDSDKISSSSIPGDRQCNTKHIESLKSSRGGAAMAVVGEKSGCVAPNTSHNLRFIRISRNDISGCGTIMGGNNEVLNCLIENPWNSCSSNEDSFNCFYGRDVLNHKKELMKHMKVHFVARNFDAAAESSIVDVSLEALPSSGHSSSCEPTISKALSGLDRKRLDSMPKDNVLVKETSGGKGDETNTRRLTRSFTLEEKSTAQSLSSKSSSIRNLRNLVGPRMEERLYSCSECTESFTQKRDLTVHKLTHTGGKRYYCSTCCKPFTQRGHLGSHMLTHAVETPFMCKVCSKSFSGKKNLYAHVRRHTGERPYSCNECEKSFMWKSDLVRHVYTHTGEKTFPCRICKKSFTRKGNLKRHSRTHTGEKPFSCNVCEKSFSDKSSLVKHVRTHTGEKMFSCNECEKSFSDKSNLVRHVRAHTGYKPYSCSNCGKCFTQSGHLKSHMQQHSGEEPYICNVCSKSFARKSHLTSHIRTHT